MYQKFSKKRISIFGIQIDAISMEDTVETVFAWSKEKVAQCKFIITPNVDHIVQVQQHEGLKSAYRNASLTVADGRPVVWAANFLGGNLPGTVCGSDLVPAVFDHAQEQKIGIKVFLLGAMPGVADRAKDIIQAQWPEVNIVGTLSPRYGFDKNPAESEEICEVVNASGADILVIGLGAPKQEVWIDNYASKINVKVALCVGAAIDFLAKEKPRAPVWMRENGLEWLHRLASEPRRLAKRYTVDAIKFPQIVFKEWQSK